LLYLATLFYLHSDPALGWLQLRKPVSDWPYRTTNSKGL
jgi:hypothetical protein